MESISSLEQQKSEAIRAINIGLVILPVIAFLSLVSIGKNFAKQKKYQIDSTQGKRLSTQENHRKDESVFKPLGIFDQK